MTNRDLSQAVWHKSAYSGGGNCVEVAGNLAMIVAVRDSKNPAGPALTFPHAAWGAFMGKVKSGEYDAKLEAAYAESLPDVPGGSPRIKEVRT